MYAGDELFEDFPVIATPVATQYTVTIDDEFVIPRQFNTIISVLQEATEDDSLIIKLSTNGGSLTAILPLVHALKARRCYVHVVAGDVASAGTLIMMLSDSVEVIDGATILFHELQYGLDTAGNQRNNSRASYHNKSSRKLLTEMYEGFLTDEELSDLFKGMEVLMDAETFMKRYYAADELDETPPDDEETIH